MSSTVRYGVRGLLAALFAGQGLYWFLGGSAADHSSLRNALVVLQIIVAVPILRWSQTKLWKAIARPDKHWQLSARRQLLGSSPSVNTRRGDHLLLGPNTLARCVLLSAVAISGTSPLRAQDTEVPHTRTFPTIEEPAFPYAHPEEAGLSSEQLERLADEITRWVANGELVGAELLIVKDGRAVFHEAYGWSDREAQKPVERNSLWSIKSMSKPFTAMAILMLAEKGRLSLDDPVARYIPNFAGDERTTIRHLLLHTSGYTGTSRLGSPEYGYATLEKAINDWAADEPERPFGFFSYSDFNYGALGYIVGEVSGIPIDAFTEKRIIQCLGLRETSTTFSPDSESATRLNPWYRWHEEAGRYEVRWSNARQPWPYYAAAWGLFSTAMDYAEFMTFWLNKGEYRGARILTEESVESALQPHVTAGTSGYGYGWFVKKAPKSDGMPPVFYHGGGDGTLAMAFPAINAIVIYLTHSRSGAHMSAFVNRLGMYEIFDHPGVYSSQLVWAGNQDVPQVELTPAERKMYVGTYVVDDPAPQGFEVIVRVWEEREHLHLRVGGVGHHASDVWWHLVPVGDHSFVPGQYHGGRLDAVLPARDGGKIVFVSEDGIAAALTFMADDKLQLSAKRKE